MAEISIALSNIQDVKTVNIEGLGLLKIRKLGSGEDLDLSFKQRRLNQLIDALNRIDFTALDAKKPSDLKKIKKLSEKADKIAEEIADIKKSQFDIYKRLLSDDKNGEIVDVIMNTLTDMERAKVFEIAFGGIKSVDSDDLVESGIGDA